MNARIKILIGILMISIILICVYLIFNTPKEVAVEFPIDSKEEAIFYVKTDPDVKEFIKEWSDQEFYKNTWAAWDSNNNVWEVGINPISDKNTHWDFLFLIHFKPDGTIIDKDIVPSA